jgi:hypothetical protein
MLSKVFNQSRIALIRCKVASFTTAAPAARISQTPLPYDLNGLEPVLTQQQMDYHYNRHHKTYVTKYNEKLD